MSHKKINLNPHKKNIIDLYVNKQMNCVDIGKIYKCCGWSISVYLGKWGIKKRKPGAIPGTITREKMKETIGARNAIMVWMPDHPRVNKTGRVPKHILVMEKKLGRPIALHEQISFLDGDKSNPVISNLIFTKDRVRLDRLPDREMLTKMLSKHSQAEVIRMLNYKYSEHLIYKAVKTWNIPRPIYGNQGRFKHDWPSPSEMKEILKKKTVIDVSKSMKVLPVQVYKHYSPFGLKDWKGKIDHRGRARLVFPSVTEIKKLLLKFSVANVIKKIGCSDCCFYNRLVPLGYRKWPKRKG